MAFFHPDENLTRIGNVIRQHAEATFARHDLPAEHFAFVLLEPGLDGASPKGFALREGWLSYPCSLVKVFFLVAVQHALERGLVEDHDELNRAQRDMIQVSSNAATNYIIDLLTGTSGDTLLPDADLPEWLERRQTVNRLFASFGWPELDGINLDQKLMDDRRYGRERQALEGSPFGHNRLTPIAMARLLYEVFHGKLLPPARMASIRSMLERDPASPLRHRGNYQLQGYLGRDLPTGTRIWSKAGRTRWLGDHRAEFRRHDALRAVLPSGQEFLMTVFTQGEAIAEDEEFLPHLGILVADEFGSNNQ